MKFGSHEVGCWGGDLSAKGKFVFSHCELHSVCIFLMGLNVADDTAICDLGTLGDFVPVDEKQLLVPWIYPSPWKRRPISLDMPFLHFNFRAPSLGSGILGPFLFWGRLPCLPLLVVILGRRLLDQSLPSPLPMGV